MIDGILKIE